VARTPTCSDRPSATKLWTLEELHSLPDDGNKYEFVRGELFVTPPPSEEHEAILTRVSFLLEPYVSKHGLGHVYAPRSVVRLEGSEVEPDRMVRRRSPEGGLANARRGPSSWETARTARSWRIWMR
jgi:Uma2 family endonuclease